MIQEILKPILEWLGIGLVPFLLGLILIVNIFKG